MIVINYNQILTPDNIIRAYIECRCPKRGWIWHPSYKYNPWEEWAKNYCKVKYEYEKKIHKRNTSMPILR